MLTTSAVAGAVEPVAVVVAATVISVECVMPRSLITFADAPAGSGMVYVGAVVPTVIEPIATFQTWMYAVAALGLCTIHPYTFPALAFTAVFVLLSAVFENGVRPVESSVPI